MLMLTLQAGADSLSFSRDMKLGVIAAAAKCWAKDQQTGLFAPSPDIGIGIPEWNPRKVIRRAGGEKEGYDVLCSFEGHPEPDNADGESFEVEGMTAEDPIESHWNFEVLLKQYNGRLDANQRAKWPLTLTDSEGKKGRNRMHGCEQWPRPGMIWNHNYVKRTLPESLIRRLGTIATTIPGNPPMLSGSRDWLLIRIRAKQRGNIWQIQESWELSLPGGSVPEMYVFNL